MLVGYDGHTIYRVYLPDEEKIIRIKDLRIEENADGKAGSHATSYDAITTSQGDITSKTPPPMPGSETLLNPTPPSPYAEPSSLYSNRIRPDIKTAKTLRRGYEQRCASTPISANRGP